MHKNLLLLLLLPQLYWGQSIPKTTNLCFFKEASSGQSILIANDSLVYKGTLAHPIALKHTDYPESLAQYTYHFNINHHTYLVHEGCGPVLEFRNDSIVRIDHSFLQKNQYGATPFVFNHQICLFGGYGLFTNKNLITQYHFKTNDWSELSTKSDEMPYPRNNANGIKIGSNWYVFGGHEKKVSTAHDIDKNLWVLNLETFKWSQLGKYNCDLFSMLSKSNMDSCNFQTETNFYHITNETIIEINILQNTITYYKNKGFVVPYKMFYDSASNAIIGLNTTVKHHELVLTRHSLTTLLQHPYTTEKFYTSSYSTYVLYGIVMGIVILLLLLGIKWSKQLKSKSIVFKTSKNRFYYGGKAITNLEVLEEKILHYLMVNSHHYIQLNQLNSFFEVDKQDNFNAIIKKRDLVFTALLFKLSTILKVEEERLILKQKNEIDKRVKEIKLNRTYFKIK